MMGRRWGRHSTDVRLRSGTHAAGWVGTPEREDPAAVALWAITSYYSRGMKLAASPVCSDALYELRSKRGRSVHGPTLDRMAVPSVPRAK